MDLDDRFTLPVAQYGVAFAFGLLYHLKNPYYFLELLSRHARQLVLSTRIARFTPGMDTNWRTVPMAYLVNPDETNDDSTNFWIFSEAGLKRLLDRTNWEIRDFCTVGNTINSEPGSANGDERAYCTAASRLFNSFAPSTILLNGWHAPEANGWRWTGKEFSIRANVPKNRTRLAFHLCLPQVIVDEFGSVTLSAFANGIPLPVVTLSVPGECTYSANVPRSASPEHALTIRFCLDKALPPRGDDERELGLIAASIDWI